MIYQKLGVAMTDRFRVFVVALLGFFALASLAMSGFFVTEHLQYLKLPHKEDSSLAGGAALVCLGITIGSLVAIFQLCESHKKG